jgi:transcriptional regulator with XRE-family HTH domain
MAKRPYYFYGSEKQKDIEKFQTASKELLELFREAKDIPELEAKIGVKRSTISKWASGLSRPNKYDVETVEKVFNTHAGFKPTINNPERKEKWVTKKIETPKRPQPKKPKPTPTKIVVPKNELITENVFDWIQRNFSEEYGDVAKYGYLLNMLQEKGIRYAMYYTGNQREAVLVTSENQDIGAEPFMYMIGVVNGAYSEVTNSNRHIQISRIARVVTGQRNLSDIRATINKGRQVYSNVPNGNLIEEYIGCFFSAK